MKHCRACGSEQMQTTIHCSYCSKRAGLLFRHQREQHRKNVLQHYSSTQPSSCECCGETNELFLSVDHIVPQGIQEKRKNKTSTYSEIVNSGFPTGLRILCMNCNHGRMRNGGICPHKQIVPLPIIPPARRIKNHYRTVKPFWIMKQRGQFVLQINDDDGFGRKYGGIYPSKEEALKSAKENWGMKI